MSQQQPPASLYPRPAPPIPATPAEELPRRSVEACKEIQQYFSISRNSRIYMIEKEKQWYRHV